MDTPSEPRPSGASRGLLGCALNFSEGRDRAAVDAIVLAAAEHCTVLDVAADTDHNRTVATLGGAPDLLIQAVLALAGEAVARIDLRTQRGVHPRLGAVDVVPFYPVFDTPMFEAVSTARRCAEQLCRRMGLPCFLYENASYGPARTLPWVRRSAFTDLAPDCGPAGPHPSAGACVVGARDFLVAYNVVLDTPEPSIARSIAAHLRAGPAALPGVRTLGLELPSRELTQVSVNIVAPRDVTLKDVFERVRMQAAEFAVRIEGSEVIGLVPRSCLGEASRESLRLHDEPHILEEAFARLQ